MARWQYYNPNPRGARVGDCVIRAISAVTDQDWNTTYMLLAFEAFAMDDMPSSNNVVKEYLRSQGFRGAVVPDNRCTNCYTVEDFADDHPRGRYVVGAREHVVAIVDGVVYDTFDSRPECIESFYYEEDR